MKKNISETAENKTYSICKNSVINLHLPEINSSQTILIYGNTINFFGVPDKKFFVGNNINEFDRLCWLITAIRNKCQFYIICIDDNAIKYYKTLFNRIYNDFNYKTDVNVELCNLVYNKEKVDGKASIDILEKNIQKYNIMKFDICIMNPPYGQSDKDTDKNLHVRFLKKTIEISNEVISIQPSTWINDPKKVKDVLGNNKAIDITIYSQAESKQMFKDAGISQELGIFKIMSGIKAKITWNNTGNTIEYKDGLMFYNPIDKFGEAVKIIFEKAKKLSDIAGVLNMHTLSKGNSNGGIPNIVANRKLQVVTDPKVLKDKWCVKLTNINQSDNTSIIMKNKSIPFKNDGTNLIGRVYCIFDNEYQANNFRSYCQTDFVRLYVKIYARASDICYSMNYIPWVPDDFNTLWDDDRIAQEIGLTESEKKFIFNQFH